MTLCRQPTGRRGPKLRPRRFIPVWVTLVVAVVCGATAAGEAFPPQNPAPKLARGPDAPTPQGPADGGKQIRLFLFTGDSNAVGFNTSPAVLPEHLARHSFTSTFVFTPISRRWEPLRPGVNTGTANAPGAWSAESQFAYRLEEAFPGDVNLIVKVAKGSTPLAQVPGADWNPRSSGELFDMTRRTLQKGGAQLPVTHGLALPPPAATFIISGPNDMWTPRQTLSFGENLQMLITGARDHWGSTYVGLSTIPEHAQAPQTQAIRDAQRRQGQRDPETEVTETRDFALQDDIHYAPSGLVALGDAFFEAWSR